MAVKTPQKLGRGTINRVALLPSGSQVLPTPITVTTGGSITAKSTSPASITVTALPAGTNIPAGTYLGFVAPTTGAVVVVQLAAAAVAAATSISVTSVPEAIAAASTCAYPLRLSGRTSANIGRDGNLSETIDFDSGGYSSGETASISQTIEMAGNYLPLDAGFLTAEYAFRNFQKLYFEIELTPKSAAYSKGKIYKGVGSITSLPVDIPADGIITGNISIAVDGELDIIDDVPV